MIKLNTWITNFLHKYEVKLWLQILPHRWSGQLTSLPHTVETLESACQWLAVHLHNMTGYSLSIQILTIPFFFCSCILFSLSFFSPFYLPFSIFSPLLLWPTDHLIPFFTSSLLSSDALSCTFTALKLPTALYYLQLQAHFTLLNRLN